MLHTPYPPCYRFICNYTCSLSEVEGKSFSCLLTSCMRYRFGRQATSLSERCWVITKIFIFPCLSLSAYQNTSRALDGPRGNFYEIIPHRNICSVAAAPVPDDHAFVGRGRKFPYQSSSAVKNAHVHCACRARNGQLLDGPFDRRVRKRH